jgi:hypothetical protein
MPEITVPCAICSGTGWATHEDRHTETRQDQCRTCGGTGQVPARPGESRATSWPDAVPGAEAGALTLDEPAAAVLRDIVLIRLEDGGTLDRILSSGDIALLAIRAANAALLSRLSTPPDLIQAAREAAAQIAEEKGASFFVEAIRAGEYDRLPSVQAALRQEEGSRGEGWQPIETAPQDGTWLETCRIGAPDPSFCGMLHNGYAEPPETAWWCIHGDRWQAAQRPHDHWQPTHWRPLSAAPTPDANSGGEAPGRDETARKRRFRRQEAAEDAFLAHDLAPLRQRIAMALDAADAFDASPRPSSQEVGDA